jgi:hypothetical protein
MAKLRVTEDSPDGLKLAFIFWNGLGRPKAFAKASVLEAWAPRLEKLTRRVSMPYSQFKWFLIWCTRLRDEDGANYGNAFTAENLRVAKNPMGSLEKQFAVTFHEIFIPRADKLVSLLQDRVQREMDDRSRTKPPIAVTWYDVIVDKDNPQPCQVEKARHMTALDERFPMLHPAPGEDMDGFVDRMFAPYAVFREWRCRKCEYGIGEDGDMDERVKWCRDCADELRMDVEDDLEMLLEVPTISCLGQW